jgi:hypothetical protein
MVGFLCEPGAGAGRDRLMPAGRHRVIGAPAPDHHTTSVATKCITSVPCWLTARQAMRTRPVPGRLVEAITSSRRSPDTQISQGGRIPPTRRSFRGGTGDGPRRMRLRTAKSPPAVPKAACVSGLRAPYDIVAARPTTLSQPGRVAVKKDVSPVTRLRRSSGMWAVWLVPCTAGSRRRMALLMRPR